MIAVLDQSNLAAQADVPVMILGESGTGKELLARAIHEAGPRVRGPFIAHNCAAVPAHLMESIFFGHARGAFTGAVRDAHGLFRLAHRGSLFLDEVADLELPLQAKLLRVLEDGVIRPVGSDQEVHVDARLIAATSRDLHDAVAAGQFREELYYRMSVLEIRVPPLRDRVEDIPVLVDHFLRKHAAEETRSPQFTPAALRFLQSLPWRGNVRELQNLVQRAMILCRTPKIDEAEIRCLIPPALARAAAVDAPRSDAGPNLAIAEASSLAVPSDFAWERQRIIGALRRAGGNKSAAARHLGLHRNSLLRRMKRLGIDREE